SNSRYAQGGIAGVLPSTKEDSVELHIKDTQEAGNGLVDYNVAKEVSKLSSQVIDDLVKYGIKFDKIDDKNYSLTLEGAHSVNRILHAGGDGTGIIMESVLSIQVLTNPKITMIENTLVTQILLNKNHEAIGIEILKRNEHLKILSNAVILATGGLGQLYEHTTNPKVATADGTALALLAGAVLQDMEFIQFHPTALAIEFNESRFLISESARGEGAKLKNSQGEYFASKYHPMGDLAPRDVLTRAIFEEMKKTQSSCVYLDMSQIPDEKLKSRFPRIRKECEKYGIDVSKDLIPVSPAAHYSMGGVKIDINGLTSIKNLYAVGEVGCSSLHGANRLASNSLLECVVLAYNLAKYLQDKDLESLENVNFEPKREFKHYENLKDLKQQLKSIMWKNAGILRSKNTLQEALLGIEKLKEKFDINAKYQNTQEYEFRNMLLVAKAIAKTALERKESRGGHFRDDYPQTFTEAKHSYLTIGDLNR
ncbi:MAG: L-aspartate oxidase, partial [bacterium]